MGKLILIEQCWFVINKENELMNKTDKLYLPVCAGNTVLINVINIYICSCAYMCGLRYTYVFSGHIFVSVVV